TVIWSGTSSPRFMIASISRPNSLPLATVSRKRSPDEMWQILRRFASAIACVPLPAPGGPSRMTYMAPNPLCNSPKDRHDWRPGRPVASGAPEIRPWLSTDSQVRTGRAETVGAEPTDRAGKPEHGSAPLLLMIASATTEDNDRQTIRFL